MMAHKAREQAVAGKHPCTSENGVRGQKSRIIQTIHRDPRGPTALIAVIKAVHSIIFLSMAASILYTLYSGLTNRISRLTAASIAAVIGEGLVFLKNDGRCPLTDLVENLGSEHGSVSDIFLPTRFAERIPVLFSPLFAIGLASIGGRRARRQPIRAAMLVTVATLFLILPWFFEWRTRRDVGDPVVA
jgi:hypothetical protein